MIQLELFQPTDFFLFLKIFVKKGGKVSKNEFSSKQNVKVIVLFVTFLVPSALFLLFTPGLGFSSGV